MAFFTRIRDAADWLSRICETLSDTLLWIFMAAMSITVFSQVLARYVFHNSIHWSEELARFLMIWLGLIGASSIMRKDSHVSITLFIEKLPHKPAMVLKIIGKFAVGIFLFMMIKYGISLSLFFIQQKSPALRISMFIPYSALYLSGILTAVHLINLTIKDITEFFTGPSAEINNNGLK